MPTSVEDGPSVRCAECGATWRDPEDACAARFDRLLALDHSHREPWGSRHGLAFAVYAVQHPARFPATSRAAAVELLTAVYRRGEDRAWAVRRLRTAMADRKPASGTPDASVPHPRDGFPVTIASLGTFEAETYASALDAWCRATLATLAALSALSALEAPR